MTDLEREELLSAYLDGEVTADERARVEAWLTESAELRQLRDELLAMRSELQALPKHTLDRDLGAAHVRRTNPAASPAPPTTTGGIIPGTFAKWWERGSGTRRLMWPAIAVAAALVILIYDANQRTQEQQVALAPQESASSSDLRDRESDRVGEDKYGSLAKDATIQAPADAASQTRRFSGTAANESAANVPVQSSPRSATAGMPLEYKAAESTRQRKMLDRKEAQPSGTPPTESPSIGVVPLNTPAPAAPMRKAENAAPSLIAAPEAPLAAAGASADAPPTIICPVSSAYLRGAAFDTLLKTNNIDYKRLPVGREQQLQVEAEQRVSRAPALQSLGAAPQKSLYHLYASGKQVSDVLSQVPQGSKLLEGNAIQLPRMTAPQQKRVDEAEHGVQVLLVAPSEEVPASPVPRPVQ
jgi:hypothetical protein